MPYDLANHLAIISYIRQWHVLPHDPAFQPYLEVNYTPGSHILAVMLGALTGADAFYLAHPIAALMAALKAGCIFNLILRIQQVRRNAATALAACVFLISGYGYFAESFTRYGFYAQIVTELFILAAIWAVTIWQDTDQERYL
jgi:hypothetical protein